jgi:hypothetical protein
VGLVELGAGEGVEDPSAGLAAVIEDRGAVAAVDLQLVTGVAAWAGQPVGVEEGEKLGVAGVLVHVFRDGEIHDGAPSGSIGDAPLELFAREGVWHRRAPIPDHEPQQMPSRDPNDPDFRRLWYVRYADDFLVGFSGPREEAEQIKLQLEEFLRDSLKLELSNEKTLITHARTEAARFLGYEIVTLDADEKHDHRGRRCINGAPGLKVPVDVVRAKCSRYTRRGKPSRLAARLHDTDFSIMTQYQAEYRGLAQYYFLAFNVHRLWRLHRVMELSLVDTLADKFKTSVERIYRKYRKTVDVPHGTQKVLEVIVDRGPKKKPLVARFGGIELRWQKHAILNDQPKEVFSVRSEVVQRLLAQKCELCGASTGLPVSHKRSPMLLRVAASSLWIWLTDGLASASFW